MTSSWNICSVRDCFEAAIERRTLVTLSAGTVGDLKPAELLIATSWCEKHREMADHYDALEIYLREDPRNR